MWRFGRKQPTGLIYTSGAIEPGYEVKEVTLEQKLKKGSIHLLHCLVSMIRLRKKKGQVAAGVNLTIE